MLEESIARIDAYRMAHPEHPVLDVQYADLVQDPLATVENLYSSLGDDLDEVAAAAMADYVSANPKGKFGVHGYDLDEFGLDGDELGERFAGYVARYDVPTERAAQMT